MAARKKVMWIPEVTANQLAAIFKSSRRLFNTRKLPCASQSGIAITRSRLLSLPPVNCSVCAKMSRPQFPSVISASAVNGTVPDGPGRPEQIVNLCDPRSQKALFSQPVNPAHASMAPCTVPDVPLTSISGSEFPGMQFEPTITVPLHNDTLKIFDAINFGHSYSTETASNFGDKHSCS
ncbi:hypothetical protein N6L27_15065 [Leisingera sp. SS27]|uniref:hypothetical protein n=1 Tax=Leisingera sp. SS27 TaxID=2979462 RepID=UPI00232EC9E2|nr:hypothetical protein [Leisingera sp. SS27]MDC0659323.1 hypothetical protein [Leisingera sp. SS27]